MIVRTWGGKVPLEEAAGFQAHLLATGVRDYRLQSGCIEIKLSRRDVDGWATFMLISIWKSIDALRAYAGDTPEVAVLYPGDEMFGLVADAHASVYDLLELESDDPASASVQPNSGSTNCPAGQPGASMTRTAHNNARLAKPIGPFAHAVRSGEFVFFSGQAGQAPASGKLVDGGVTEQVHQPLSNFGVLLEEMVLTFDHVVKVNVFLTNMSDFDAMDQEFVRHFAAPYPARTTVAVKELPMHALIEMEMIARLP